MMIMVKQWDARWRTNSINNDAVRRRTPHQTTSYAVTAREQALCTAPIIINIGAPLKKTICRQSNCSRYFFHFNFCSIWIWFNHFWFLSSYMRIRKK